MFGLPSKFLNLGLSSRLNTALVITGIRTLCCLSSVQVDQHVGIRPVRRELGHHNYCPTTRTLPKLADVCVWKPPTRYCLPSWCHPQHGHIPTSHFCKRCYMTEEELLKDPDCEADDLRQKFDTKNVYIIDVRKPEELEETGKIPGAINIPLDVFEEALKMSDIQFIKMYNARKPEIDGSDVVINCRSGVRSLTALKIARNLGMHKSRHLPGGFLLWQEKFKDLVANVPRSNQ